VRPTDAYAERPRNRPKRGTFGLHVGHQLSGELNDSQGSTESPRGYSVATRPKIASRLANASDRLLKVQR
jgi:hypothetical protein